MYLQFYGFKEAPFNLTPDSKFLFLSHRHQEALAALLFGVQERKGFICLTGEIGCGKTTLCRAMLSQLDPDQVKICVVLNSYLNDLELLKTINEGFSLASDSESKKKLIDTLNEFLVREFSLGHNIVLIIDESQNLRPDTLEQIRMISNLETETAKLIQIVLIGQPELRRTLTLPELEQLNQRITVRYHIAPLDESEVGEYIRHRIAVAEPQVDVTFTPQAVKLIFHYSRGIPRRINVICDRCLLVGYVTGTFNIDDRAVERAVTEVQGDLQNAAAPAAAGEESAAAAAAVRGRSGKKFVEAAKVLAYLLIIVIGVALITNWASNFDWSSRFGAKVPSNQPTHKPETKNAAPDPKQNRKNNKSRKVAQAAPTPDQKVMTTSGPNGQTTTVTNPMTEQPTAPAASPTPRPTPRPTTYANWQYDGDKVLRVADPRLAETAAYLNMVLVWKIEVDLEPFRQASPDYLASCDMLKTLKQQLNFDAVRADTLGEAFKLRLPVLVHLRDPKGGQSAWKVVSALNGEVVELIDPLKGKSNAERKSLDGQVIESLVLYKDNYKLAQLKPGDQNEMVLKLQSWLIQDGLFKGTPDGKFGSQTRDAIELFQQKNNLNPTGRIDEKTGAILAGKLDPQQPRLYP